jgi:hypothetical protein
MDKWTKFVRAGGCTNFWMAVAFLVLLSAANDVGDDVNCVVRERGRMTSESLSELITAIYNRVCTVEHYDSFIATKCEEALAIIRQHDSRTRGLGDAEPKEEAKEQGVKVPPGAADTLLGKLERTYADCASDGHTPYQEGRKHGVYIALEITRQYEVERPVLITRFLTGECQPVPDEQQASRGREDGPT